MILRIEQFSMIKIQGHQNYQFNPGSDKKSPADYSAGLKKILLIITSELL